MEIFGNKFGSYKLITYLCHMGKINDIPQSLYNILNIIPSDMPFALIKAISNWKTIIKSPYGHSYYSGKVDWVYKEPNSFRIADHWNFTSQGNVHCETTAPVPNNTHYTIAIFDDTSKKYVPISIYPKETKCIKGTLKYRLLFADTVYERSIKHQTNTIGHLPNFAKYRLDLDLNYYEKISKMLEKSLASV